MLILQRQGQESQTTVSVGQGLLRRFFAVHIQLAVWKAKTHTVKALVIKRNLPSPRNSGDQLLAYRRT